MLHESPVKAWFERYLLSEARPGGGLHSGAHRPGAAVGVRAPAAVELNVIPYALPDAGEVACEIVADLGEVEAEYAAIRRAAGLMDQPQRGTIVVTGKDRREFLNRMITQELKGLEAGRVVEAFWLNRKGRIDADMRLMELGERLFISLDIHQAAGAVKTLNEFVFSEDVEIRDASSEMHHIALHGPEALAVLRAATHTESLLLGDFECVMITIAGIHVAVGRRDETGEPGFELIVPIADAVNVWEALYESGRTRADANGGGKTHVRAIGWHAYNIARIEAGTPLFNVDFGVTNLPHESGVLRERVSFTKGCYLGQEVVARMESLGKPKQKLVALRFARALLPVAGSQVFAMEKGAQGEVLLGAQVGVVTSSTISPMLSAEPIALAMVRTAAAEPGTKLLVNAEGEQVEAEVQKQLRFWEGGRP